MTNAIINDFEIYSAPGIKMASDFLDISVTKRTQMWIDHNLKCSQTAQLGKFDHIDIITK